MVLFVFSDLGLGTVVNIVFFAGEDVTTIGPAFSFSVMTLSRDSLKGGRANEKGLGVIHGGFGVVVPFQKGATLSVFIPDVGKIRWATTYCWVTYNNLRFAVLRRFCDALYHGFEWRVEQLKML